MGMAHSGNSITSKVALVTGANRGLGFEIARQLGQAGSTVVIGARDPQRGDRAAALLRAEGLGAETATLDVADPASVQDAARELRDRFGTLDILVNNAGIAPEAATECSEVVSASLFRHTFHTNLIGAVSTVEWLLPLLRRSEAGRIVNVSTTMGSLADQSDPGSPYYATVVPAYQASKAALNSVTVGLAKLLADTPIKVNAICPGFVQTDITPMNRDHAPLTPADAARVVVRYALIDDDGPSGGFFDADGPIAW